MQPCGGLELCGDAVQAEEFVFWVNSGIMCIYKAPREGGEDGREEEEEEGEEPPSSPSPLLPLVPPPTPPNH